VEIKKQNLAPTTVQVPQSWPTWWHTRHKRWYSWPRRHHSTHRHHPIKQKTSSGINTRDTLLIQLAHTCIR